MLLPLFSVFSEDFAPTLFVLALRWDNLVRQWLSLYKHLHGFVMGHSCAVPDVEVGNSRNSTQDVAWGPLVFEARRFVELRKKSLWQQFLSAESFGMGLFYTLNVRPFHFLGS